jgi:hypothetical protein
MHFCSSHVFGMNSSRGSGVLFYAGRQIISALCFSGFKPSQEVAACSLCCQGGLMTERSLIKTLGNDMNLLTLICKATIRFQHVPLSEAHCDSLSILQP